MPESVKKDFEFTLMVAGENSHSHSLHEGFRVQTHALVMIIGKLVSIFLQ